MPSIIPTSNKEKPLFPCFKKSFITCIAILSVVFFKTLYEKIRGNEIARLTDKGGMRFPRLSIFLSRFQIQFRSIRHEFLLKIGLVALIPLLFISVFNYQYYRQSSIDSTADIQSLINNNTATKIHLYIMAQQLYFIEFSKHSVPAITTEKDAFTLRDRMSIRQFVTGMHGSLGFFDALLICDENGRVLGSSSKDLGLVKTFTDFSPSAGFAFSKVGPVQYGDHTLNAQVAVMPLSKAAKRLYLVGVSTLSALTPFVEEERMRMQEKHLEKSIIMLVNTEDNQPIFTHTNETVIPEGIDWGTVDDQNRQIRNGALVWYADTDLISIGSQNYHLTTIVTKKDILYSATKMLQITLALVCITLTLIAGMVLLLSNQFTAPLQRIKERMKSIAAGDYRGRIQVCRQDELGQLSDSANQMTDDLESASNKIQQQMTEIKAAHKQSDQLLLNILPPSIADRLKGGEENIADKVDSASVLFSDIVGFTQFSSTMDAPALVKALNHLYSLFDDLLGEYPVEKIKSMGDGLMLVAGLPDPDPDHAVHMVNYAKAMGRVLQQFNEESQHHLQLRVGIHSGPVVAGVIGKRKFAYDLWGDTCPGRL